MWKVFAVFAAAAMLCLPPPFWQDLFSGAMYRLLKKERLRKRKLRRQRERPATKNAAQKR